MLSFCSSVTRARRFRGSTSWTDLGSPSGVAHLQPYHLMVGIGMLFIASHRTHVLRLRGTLFGQRWLLWYFVLAVVPAIAANEVGWVVRKSGGNRGLSTPHWKQASLSAGSARGRPLGSGWSRTRPRFDHHVWRGLFISVCALVGRAEPQNPARPGTDHRKASRGPA